MGGGGEGGSNGGGGKELIETVLTYEGNISDPELPLKITHLIHHLRIITNCESRDWLVRKVEPWNSVRVTFSIPKEAAGRLHQLAQAGDAALRQLGILSVQVEGDQVVSLKVAGPNHETTEILIRAEGSAGPSNEVGCHSSSVARSVTQALGGATVLPGFGQQQQQQQHHQPNPVPQFRSPSAVGSDGIPMIVGRNPVTQQRPQGQGYGYAGAGSNTAAAAHSRHVQPIQSPAGVLVSGGSLSHPSVVARPVFPSNPPPPYPSQDLRQSTNTPQQQIAAVTQVTGQQYLVTQANSVITQPPQTILQHSSQQLNSLGQTVTGSYRMSGSQVSVTNNASAPINRGQVRTQVSMIKNSPLLVGLLQQPEQPSSVVGPRNNKCVTVNPPQSSVSLSISNSAENGPISSVISSTSTVSSLASAGTYIGRSKDGLTTHQQIFSGGSVITNSVPPPPPPPPRHHNASGLQHTPLSGQPSPTSPASRLQGSDDYRRIVGSSTTTNIRNKPGHLQSILQSSSSGSVVKDDHKESNSIHSSSSLNKKESQYLINPNTGLLEPRPNTDSSDSEPEGRTESPHDDQRSNSVPSDDESNLSAASRKETDHSDSDVSRVSVASIESKKLMNSDRGKSQDRESSPGSSWENNNAVNSNPGEKIKLRLKLGKEQVAQATIVGNANKKIERRELAGNTGMNSQSLSEPRVPKLHIKLHSHQPIIIKSVEENEASNKKSSKELPLVRDDKSKRKSGRSKPRNNESDFDPSKSKSVKFKSNKDKTGDEAATQVLKILESKKNKLDSDFEDNSFLKFKESADSRVKVPRILEVSKPSKLESKLRTRLKKPPMRKVGDLNSVGEIASHKIMETLPPSITKVAAMHTQQPHRNPNSLSPVPFSSISTNMFSGSSISASFSTSPPLSSTSSSPPSSSFTCPPSGDHLKAELEKRGSEIISKTDLKVELEKNSSSDILMSKLCMNNPSLKTLMNGDASHNEKVTINQMRFKRTGSLASPTDFSSASKLTIKRKNSEETHTLKALKKEGLSTVPTFLNSSVLINKVSPEKSSVSSLSSGHRQNDDLTEKLLKKVESIKGPLRNEIAGLKSNSDITIHSVSKNDILNLSKASDFDRRADLTIKTKSDVTTKVGRVTCVDVMDRKALEEALKSSRNSSKRNDITFCKSTSSMVDRLRRWNSIDSSNSVPLNTHSQQQTSDSTNLNSSTVKAEIKESDESESEKSMILSTVIEKVKTEPSVSQQSNTIINVNSENDCDNSGKDNLDKSIPIKSESNKDIRNEKVSDNTETKLEEKSDCETKNKFDESSCEMTKTSPVLQSECKSLSGFDVNTDQSSKSLLKDRGKSSDLGNSGPLVKTEVDSPEGTPKGEHGNAQGGEDSGIESMDALSEKSPNHSDQSPNRREDKDCELFQDKCKNRSSSVSSKPLKAEDKDLPKKKGESELCNYSGKSERENVKCEKGTSDDNSYENNLKSDISVGEEEKKSLKVSSSGTIITCKPVKSEESYMSNFNESQVIGESKLNKIPIKVEDLENIDNKIENSEDIEKSETAQIISNTSKCNADSSIPSSFVSKSESSELCQSNIFLPKVTDINHLVEASSAPHNLHQPLNKHKNVVSNITSEQVDKKPESSSDESLSSSQDNFLDTPISETITDTGEKETNSKKVLEDIQVSTVLCSTSLSINTTSISVTSPKSSVTTSSNILVSPYISLPSLSICGGNSDQSSNSSSKDNSKQGNLFSHSKEVSPFNSGYKPSLLAITLSRPPGSSIVTSQFASNYEKMSSTTSTGPIIVKSTSNSVGGICTTTTITTAIPTISTITITPTSTSTTTTITTTAGAKAVSSIETQSNTSSATSVVYCHSLSCNNNSLAYCNSFTTTTNTTATMIILAASTNSCSTAITPSTPNSTKVVTLKPSINQPNNSAINPPVGKTFRLVALPGINSMTPVASPVKGQLVTLKPVVGSGIVPTIAKSAQVLQTLPPLKSDEPIVNSTGLRSHSTTTVVSLTETVSSQMMPETIVNENHPDDLDFVGFSNSSTGDSKVENGCKQSGSISVEKCNNNKLLSPVEEEPTPMRVHPPLYTYGNRERKKEVESDVEEKEKEEGKEIQSKDNSPHLPTKPSSLENDTESKEKEGVVGDPLKTKPKEKKLHALTIEIPNVENYPDDKRLTRSTRQSARLASPKVSSPAASGELSPRSDKKSPANTQAMGKPSPLGTVRSSVSPALRVAKRRRHESESSNASNVSEDQSEPLVKTKRKVNQELKDETKSKNYKREFEQDRERDIESSDDESLLEEEISKKRNASMVLSNNEEEEESRPSSRTGRPVTKAIKRSRDRSTTSDSQPTSRDTTPTRRTPRQNRVNSFVNVVNQVGTGAAAVVSNAHDNSPERVDSESKEKLSTSPILEYLPKGEDISKDLKEGEKKAMERKGVASPLLKDGGGTNKLVTKGKKEGETEVEVAMARRKTRSTTNAATTIEDANKRRRMSKEK